MIIFINHSILKHSNLNTYVLSKYTCQKFSFELTMHIYHQHILVSPFRKKREQKLLHIFCEQSLKNSLFVNLDKKVLNYPHIHIRVV